MDVWDLLLWLVVQTHLLVAPFTKVEESFFVQGIYDMTFHGTQLAKVTAVAACCTFHTFSFDSMITSNFLVSSLELFLDLLASACY